MKKIHQLPGNHTKTLKIRLPEEPYLFINLILAGIIILMLCYFIVFSPESNNYPVSCIHEKLTGQPCPSCGLSHSLSLILRGSFSKASEWNIFGMRIFIFFISQLLLRIVFSFYFLKLKYGRNNLIFIDATGSGIMVLLTFWPFLRWMTIILAN
ncbi:MAG TPA: DUF2752 domain-containing protein [Bacteroidales bacterium]|nr:DUF2752 domain-containing protein [Bacteroidales bacterium]